MKKTITFDWPIISGSISKAKSQCGKEGCACKKQQSSLHGTYYRWTGFIKGKRTTKTISKQTAQECKKQITNFRKLQREIEILLEKAISTAPWNSKPQKIMKRRRR